MAMKLMYKNQSLAPAKEYFPATCDPPGEP